MGTGIWKHMCYRKISLVLCSYHLRDFQMNRELQNTTGSLRSPSRFHVGFEKPWLLGLYGQFPHMASHRTHWKVFAPMLTLELRPGAISLVLFTTDILNV